MSAGQQQRREDDAHRGGRGREEPDGRRAGHPRARPRAPQDGPEQREQQVPGGVDAAVSDLYQGDGQQHDGEGEHESQHRGADVPRADVEDEQRASGRDERSGDREGGRRARAAADRSRTGRSAGGTSSMYPLFGDQQVPGFLQRLRQEDFQILGVDTIPDREPDGPGRAPASPRPREGPRRPGGERKGCAVRAGAPAPGAPGTARGAPRWRGARETGVAEEPAAVMDLPPRTGGAEE